MWRVLSGALAVKERLRSRSIPVNATCARCGAAQESICHMLFTCSFAQEVWSKSAIPLPSSGFSPSSVFLNLHFLLSRSSKKQSQQNPYNAFPWLIWHIWKARNHLCFEQTRLASSLVVEKAREDYVIWSELHENPASLEVSNCGLMDTAHQWSKPPPEFMKCNIGSSWVGPASHSGVSWIVRDHQGSTVFHSRRSYSRISSSVENDLISFFWAVESLRNMRVRRVIFQASTVEARAAFLQPSAFPTLLPLIISILEMLNSIQEWSLEHVSATGNQPALAIASSVTRDHRHQSYIARNSPSWLQQLIMSES